jgi:hypothetical protein
VPQDINPDSSTKSALVDNESPKVDKPLTPPSPRVHEHVGTSSGPEPDEFPKASPLSPWSYGLRATDGYYLSRALRASV